MITLGLGRLRRYEESDIQPDPLIPLDDPIKHADFVNEQYTPLGLKISDVAASWEAGYRGRTRNYVPVPVFVLDTGGAGGHPDLMAAFGGYPRRRGMRHGKRARSLVTGGLDQTEKDWEKSCFYKGRYHTRNWYDVDKRGHGTHVAGTIGARDNKFGIVGVAPECDIWALRVFKKIGKGMLFTCDAWIAKAIRRAIQIAQRYYDQPDGLRGGVINLSLGTRGTMSGEVRKALQAAVAAGFVIVAAAGNDGKGVNLPAAWPECIAVGAMSRKKRRMKWSSHGEEVDAAAVGEGVWSTVPSSGYQKFDGTSMAAPFVSGMAALWKGKHADWGVRANTLAFRKALEGATVAMDKDILAEEPGWRYVDSPRLAAWLSANDPQTRRRLPIPGRDIEIVC